MSSQALLNLLIQTSEKAWRKGGGGGASSGLGGGGGHGRGKGPGSRGGHFWINSNGRVEYGPKPKGARSGDSGGHSKAPHKVTAITSSRQRAGITGADVKRLRQSQGQGHNQGQSQGQRAVRTGRGGGSGKPVYGELRAGHRIKPQTGTQKLQGKKRMLSEMDKAIRSGKDPHGNPLSADSLHQLNILATGLRTEVRMGGGFKEIAKAIATKAKSEQGKNKTEAKIATLMGEFKKGTLNTGSPKGPGPRVTNPKQAIAIALSQARKVGKKATLPIMPLAQPDPTRPADIQQVHTGVMLALMVPPGIGQAIAVPGGEPVEDLHLTLAYLGDSTEMPRENMRLVQDALDEFYRTAKPISGEISGVGLFSNGAFYASFDSPDLAAFRSTLLSCLDKCGITPVSNHGFTPHITLAYLPEGSPLPAIPMPQLQVTFKAVTLAWGDQHFDYLLEPASLRPNEADEYLATFDRGLDAASKETKTKETDPGGSFTVFKDKQGAWRWVAVSSSGFQDRDGETVSTKALADDVARHDALGEYGPLKLGPLDWWHTPIIIGDCDFNGMHGKLLVESGTFRNPAVAEQLAQRIASKEFNPSVSLEFTHNEPGPRVLPGRVFNQIHKVRRALLPAEAASNIATTFQVVNPANASTGLITKEVKKQMDANKEKRLRELLGPGLADEFLAGTERSEKALEIAGVAFKAAAALDKPMDKSPMNAAPAVQTGAVATTAPAKTTKKDDLEGALDPNGMDSSAEDMAGAEGEDGEEEGDYEDSPTDQEADAILENLYTRIGQIVNDRVKATAEEILAAVNGLGSSSTKEVAALEAVSVALKEHTAALSKVTGENTALKEKVATLETQVAALNGTQPPAVQARLRPSQGKGMSAAQLTPELQNLVSSEKQAEDPYVAAAGNFLRGWPGAGIGQQ